MSYARFAMAMGNLQQLRTTIDSLHPYMSYEDYLKARSNVDTVEAIVIELDGLAEKIVKTAQNGSSVAPAELQEKETPFCPPFNWCGERALDGDNPNDYYTIVAQVAKENSGGV